MNFENPKTNDFNIPHCCDFCKLSLAKNQAEVVNKFTTAKPVIFSISPRNLEKNALNSKTFQNVSR